MWRVVNNDELYHHGRKGQQWGVTNGPPYPLGQTNKEYKKQQLNNRLTVLDYKAVKYVKKHDKADRKIAKIQNMVRKKGENNVGALTQNKLQSLVNSRQKYRDAVSKIDDKTRKLVSNILDKGYDITVNDEGHPYRDRHILPSKKHTAWGHNYTLSESSSRKGTLRSYTGSPKLGHYLGDETKGNKRSYSKMLGIRMT